MEVREAGKNPTHSGVVEDDAIARESSSTAKAAGNPEGYTSIDIPS